MEFIQSLNSSPVTRASAVESHCTGAFCFLGEWNSVFLSHNIFLLLPNISQSHFFLLLFCIRDVNLSLSSAILLADTYGNSKDFNYANDS